MKKEIKYQRIFVYVLCITFALAVLTGCDKPTTTATTPQGEDNTEQTIPVEQQIENCFSNSDRDASYDSVTATVVLSDGGHSVQGEGVTAEENRIHITAAGTYLFSGSCSDGQIVIDAGKEDKVRVVFNAVDLCNTTDAAMIVNSADKVTLTLAEHTINRLSDGNTTASPATRAEGANACLYSREDLVINGAGSLTVEGNFNNGIISKDDLRIVSGTIQVSARNNGIKGKDCVSVLDANITVNSDDDGIKSDNDTDAGRGVVSIFGGTIHITCGDDGIQAYNSVQITGGTVVISAGGNQVKTESGENIYVAEGCLSR